MSPGGSGKPKSLVKDPITGLTSPAESAVLSRRGLPGINKIAAPAVGPT